LKYGSSRPLTARFKEGLLDFRPTFKYNDESNEYDTSKKMRVPSWTDRILYKPDNCTLKYYNRRENQFSDHRPVLAIFECRVMKTDLELKEKIEKEQIELIQNKK
jgi:synaptojanin